MADSSWRAKLLDHSTLRSKVAAGEIVPTPAKKTSKPNGVSDSPATSSPSAKKSVPAPPPKKREAQGSRTPPPKRLKGVAPASSALTVSNPAPEGRKGKETGDSLLYCSQVLSCPST